MYRFKKYVNRILAFSNIWYSINLPFCIDLPIGKLFLLTNLYFISTYRLKSYFYWPTCGILTYLRINIHVWAYLFVLACVLYISTYPRINIPILIPLFELTYFLYIVLPLYRNTFTNLLIRIGLLLDHFFLLTYLLCVRLP